MKPFEVAFPQDQLDALRRRLRETRWPSATPAGWALGPDDRFVRRLVDHWVTNYDWRILERRINRHPQFLVDVDGHRLHFLHEQATSPNARPLLLMHGWPYSFASFVGIVDRLAHPERFGGDPDHAFHVVCPSLPGFGFSAKPAEPLACRAMAPLMDKLMSGVLGYPRYLAAGGDWGGHIAEWMGLDCAERVDGVHTSIISVRPETALRGSGTTDGIETEAVRRFVADEKASLTKNYGYAFQQGTRPQALAFGMMDSPAGTAAWMLDKFHDWSDLRARPFEQVFTMNQLLDEIMIYEMTGTFDTSTWIYAGTARSTDFLRQGERIEVPVAVARFHDPIAPVPPREFVERSHHVVQWNEFESGGHFPFHETPAAYVADIVGFERLLRTIGR